MPGATPPITAVALNRPRSKSNFHFADDTSTTTHRDALVFPPTPGDAAQTFNALVDEEHSNGATIATTTILKSKGKGKAKEVVCEQPPIAIGIQPDDVYDAQMSWWRAGVRRMLVRNLQIESEWVAAMQERIRRPVLDSYFVYTSNLGTHTFFMILLPCFFFFGFNRAGYGLINQLGMGVYLSSLLKDLVCSPRPFAPPVTRLTIGSHHLEYGFPSTHSTNSVSIALHLWTLLYTAREGIPEWTYIAAQVVLAFYAFSIVFGRLYCGMHSFSDCAAGVMLGAGIWAAHLALADPFHAWLTSGGWQVPLISILACLFAVNQHAEPVDDCPCFEDAIAFISVMMGCAVSAWWRARFGFDYESGYFTTSPPEGWPMFVVVTLAKLVLGILIVFVWRLAAKPVLHAILPPIFRGLATLFTLPSRRFYIPATDYRTYPHERLLQHPIPSVIDLPAMGEDQLGGGLPTTMRRRKAGGEKTGIVRLREGSDSSAESLVEVMENDESKRYDANVLTKVIVYAGIAFLASGLTPVLFEYIGWGVYQR